MPINYFFEDFSEYLLNLEKSKEGHMNVNYNFLVKFIQNLMLIKIKKLQISGKNISKQFHQTKLRLQRVGFYIFDFLAPRAGLEPATN